MKMNLPAKMKTAYKALGDVMGRMTVVVATGQMKKVALVRKSIN